MAVNLGKMSITGLDKDICARFCGKMHHDHAEMTTWPTVQSPNRKLIRVIVIE